MTKAGTAGAGIIHGLVGEGKEGHRQIQQDHIKEPEVKILCDKKLKEQLNGQHVQMGAGGGARRV